MKQAAGPMKFRRVSSAIMHFRDALVKVDFARGENCLLHLHAWCPTATASVSEHPAPTEALKSRRPVW